MSVTLVMTENPKFGNYKNVNSSDVSVDHENNGSHELTNTDGLNRLDSKQWKPPTQPLLA